MALSMSACNAATQSLSHASSADGSSLNVSRTVVTSITSANVAMEVSLRDNSSSADAAACSIGTSSVSMSYSLDVYTHVIFLMILKPSTYGVTPRGNSLPTC